MEQSLEQTKQEKSFTLEDILRSREYITTLEATFYKYKKQIEEACKPTNKGTTKLKAFVSQFYSRYGKLEPTVDNCQRFVNNWLGILGKDPQLCTLRQDLKKMILQVGWEVVYKTEEILKAKEDGPVGDHNLQS